MREDRPGGAGGQRSIDVDHDRERLRDLSARLMKLHRALLDRERRRYEDRRGSIPSGELLQVVITDPQFAWLRSLSAMVAEIDATVDAGDPMTEETVARMLQGAYELLKSGGNSEFQLKYAPCNILATVSSVIGSPA